MNDNCCQEVLKITQQRIFQQNINQYATLIQEGDITNSTTINQSTGYTGSFNDDPLRDAAFCYALGVFISGALIVYNEAAKDEEGGGLGQFLLGVTTVVTGFLGGLSPALRAVGVAAGFLSNPFFQLGMLLASFGSGVAVAFWDLPGGQEEAEAILSDVDAIEPAIQNAACLILQQITYPVKQSSLINAILAANDEIVGGLTDAPGQLMKNLLLLLASAFNDQNLYVSFVDAWGQLAQQSIAAQAAYPCVCLDDARWVRLSGQGRSSVEVAPGVVSLGSVPNVTSGQYIQELDMFRGDVPVSGGGSITASLVRVRYPYVGRRQAFWYRASGAPTTVEFRVFDVDGNLLDSEISTNQQYFAPLIPSSVAPNAAYLEVRVRRFSSSLPADARPELWRIEQRQFSDTQPNSADFVKPASPFYAWGF